MIAMVDSYKGFPMNQAIWPSYMQMKFKGHQSYFAADLLNKVKKNINILTKIVFWTKTIILCTLEFLE